MRIALYYEMTDHTPEAFRGIFHPPDHLHYFGWSPETIPGLLAKGVGSSNIQWRNNNQPAAGGDGDQT